MFLGAKQNRQKNVLHLREFTSARCFSCQANLLVRVCLLLLHDYLRLMTLRLLQSCSCSAVIAGFVACLPASLCLVWKRSKKLRRRRTCFHSNFSQSQVMLQAPLSVNQLLLSPPAQSCRKSSFGQDWLPVQEVHRPQICPAEVSLLRVHMLI